MSNSSIKVNQTSDLSSETKNKLSLKANQEIVSNGLEKSESLNKLTFKRNSISVKNNESTNTNSQESGSSNDQTVKTKSSKKRTRTIYPPLQKNYGPKATLKKVTDDYLLLIQDPLSQQLSWTKAPLYVLVIKKLCNTLFEPFIEILKYLIYDHNMICYVEESEYENEIFNSDVKIKAAMSPLGKNTKPSLRKFCESSLNYTCKNRENTDTNKIDFVICLGGDGTLLHASGLFQQSCPPLLSIHLGSLGFLCPFDFDKYSKYISSVIKGGVPLLLRNRLKCKLEKISDSPQKIEESNGSVDTAVSNQPNIVCNGNKCYDEASLSDVSNKEFLCLNEVVVGRGCSPFLSNLDLYVNEYLITTVQGDGLIISTPTGSTAYAMAAGASMCHPSVQSIIIAPICPHSLSFRPVVVPAGVELRVALSPDSRHNAWFSVDGRNTTELKQGYYISITTSEYPLPSICRSDQINDWFEGLATCLHWNQRQKQLPLNSCYLQSQNQGLTNSQSYTQLQSLNKSPSTSSFKSNEIKSENNDSNKKLNDNDNTNKINQENDSQ